MRGAIRLMARLDDPELERLVSALRSAARRRPTPRIIGWCFLMWRELKRREAARARRFH
jgi:hypothetical protein